MTCGVFKDAHDRGSNRDEEDNEEGEEANGND